MSKIAFTPNVSGSGIFTIASPNGNTDRTVTLPDQDGTIFVTSGGNDLTTTGTVDAGSFELDGNSVTSILGISELVDGVDFTTTSATDVNLSTNTNYTPVSNQSSFIVFSETSFTMTYVLSGNNNTNYRSVFRLSYHDGTEYQSVNAASQPLLGASSLETNSTTRYWYGQFNSRVYLGQSALRSDTGTLDLRIRGHRDYDNLTLTTTATNIMIIEVE